MNLAATADGKIDTFERRGAAISTARDKERVDRLRADSDAVMVGGKTLHDEDPALTLKSAALREERKALGLPENPAKVGIATRLALNLEGRFLTAGPARVLLFTTPHTPDDEMAGLRALGAEIFVRGSQRVDLVQAMKTLKEQGIERLMVEGGATLNFEMLTLGLVDELRLFLAPMIFGGETAPTAAGGFGLSARAAVRLKLLNCEAWDDGGVLLRYQVRPGG
jgi:2,5-diamino-6-(ribosylamino)-4(3H)-pyrimidinone 5'-phosphate reductase